MATSKQNVRLQTILYSVQVMVLDGSKIRYNLPHFLNGRGTRKQGDEVVKNSISFSGVSGFQVDRWLIPNC